MKPNELRIGNYVHLGGKNTQIYELCHDFVTTTLDNGNYEYIYGYVEPIPITAGWLEALGFKNKMNHYEKGHALWISLEYLGNPTETSIWIHGNYCPAVKIKFVHELQNLFFALTKEDLFIPEFDLSQPS